VATLRLDLRKKSTFVKSRNVKVASRNVRLLTLIKSYIFLLWRSDESVIAINLILFPNRRLNSQSWIKQTHENMRRCRCAVKAEARFSCLLHHACLNLFTRMDRDSWWFWTRGTIQTWCVWWGRRKVCYHKKLASASVVKSESAWLKFDTCTITPV